MRQGMIKRFSLALILSFFLSSAWAGSPITQLQGMANHMIAGLASNKGRLQSEPRIVTSLVRRYLLPTVDATRMSRQVVGRYWRQSSSGQKKQFQRLFTNLVVSTYASALASYDGDVVKFYPLRGRLDGRSTVMVRSLIVRRNGQTIPVNYYMVRKGNKWVIYDFTIENVSMVQSYRAQFADTLAAQGMAGLISKLRSR